MEPTRGEQATRPEIVENYRSFEPPANSNQKLEELLDAVPAKIFRWTQQYCANQSVRVDERPAPTKGLELAA
jgi:hypothetical protein